MEIKLLEIILPPEGNSEGKMIVEWFAESALSIIIKQEDGTQKFHVKTLTDTPAIYMS